MKSSHFESVNMQLLTLFAFIFICTLNLCNAQPEKYRSRGVHSYIVNYNAIQSNFFLTKFAIKRFALLDEASRDERKLIRKIDSNYLILKYKDVVALNDYLPEYDEMNNQEYAFLHCSEPAGLNISKGKNWKFNWIPDRRFKPSDTLSIAYKLYFAFDSTGEFSAVDTLIENTELDIALPKSARWVKIKTVLNKKLELDYSFIKKLYYDDNLPQYYPKSIRFWLNDKYNGFINMQIKRVSEIKADSLLIYADLNINNRFDNNEVFRFSGKFDSLELKIEDFEIWKDRQYRGGIKFYFIAKSGKDSIRIPEYGYWSTNANNRIKNGYYGFYVMDVGSEIWLNSYIQQVKNAFDEGYNGLFADDTWYRISPWGVDAMPINYSDSVWFENIKRFITETQKTISPKPLFFNGLYSINALPIVEYATGGMTEGFATTHWSGYVHTNYWRELCNVGLLTQKQYKKQWMALAGNHNDNPLMRIYNIASYLLIADSLALYGDAPNYQTFAHYPEFDIPAGMALHSAVSDINELIKYDLFGNTYYYREFEKCSVFVNPSNTKQVILPELKSMNCIALDSLPTHVGGRLFTAPANDTLKPMSAVIILKGEKPILCSPSIKNALIKASKYQSDKIKLSFEVEVSDSSTAFFRSRSDLPLYVAADLTQFGILEDLILINDGTPASQKYSKYTGEVILYEGAVFSGLSIPIVAYSTTGLVSIKYATIENLDIDTSNMLINFSFEYDLNNDGIPDYWRPYYKGFEIDSIASNVQHGRKAIKVKNESLEESGGIYYVLRLNQTEPKKFIISGWSKAENVSGTKNNDYSIYVDCYYNDGTPLYGQTAQFNTGTHNWEYSEKIIEPTKPIKQMNIYCLFRRHTGTVWFDNINLREYRETSIYECESNQSNSDVLYNQLINEDLIISYNSNIEGKIIIEIYNLLGNRIAQEEISVNAGMNKIILPNFAQKLNNGIYLLTIGGEKIYTEKIIIYK